MLLRFPELADTFEAISRHGSAELYGGERARAMVATVRDGGGDLTLADLASYRPVWRRPVRVPFAGHEVLSNPPPSSGGVLIAYGLALLARLPTGSAGSADAVAVLAEVMREQGRARGGGFTRDLHRGGLAARLLSTASLREAKRRIERGLAGKAEPAPPGGTTHVSVIDAEGNAAALSSSTGSGSGVIVPGTGIYLNNMLGEYDLVGGRSPRPGARLTSMMAPTIALAPDGSPRLVVGSAGSARLRGAIMQIVVNVLQHGLDVEEAVDAPRIHVDEPHVHCEGGHDPAELDRLAERGYDLVRWRRRNLFFGGAAAVEMLPDGTEAAAGDPAPRRCRSARHVTVSCGRRFPATRSASSGSRQRSPPSRRDGCSPMQAGGARATSAATSACSSATPTRRSTSPSSKAASSSAACR